MEQLDYLIVYRDANGKHHKMTTKGTGFAMVVERFVMFCQEQRIDPVSVTIETTGE